MSSVFGELKTVEKASPLSNIFPESLIAVKHKITKYLCGWFLRPIYQIPRNVGLRLEIDKHPYADALAGVQKTVEQACCTSIFVFPGQLHDNGVLLPNIQQEWESSCHGEVQ